MNLPRQVTTALSTLLASALFLVAGCKGATASPEPKTEEQKTIYALGLMMGRNIGVFNLTPQELELVKAGLSDSINKKKPVVELETYGPKLDALARSRSTATAQAEKQKAKTVVEAAEREPGAMKLPSGMVIRTVKAGTGATPVASDTVKVHYTGTLTDGTVFDSSVKRNEPATFPLGRRDQVLDRGPAEDEGRREGEADLPVRRRLRRQWPAADDSGRRDPDLRRRAARHHDAQGPAGHASHPGHVLATDDAAAGAPDAPLTFLHSAADIALTGGSHSWGVEDEPRQFTRKGIQS